MPDLLIRDIPQEVLDALDDRAVRLGLSRAELLRRFLAAIARHSRSRPTTTDDLKRFAELASDLLDPQIMDRAAGRDDA